MIRLLSICALALGFVVPVFAQSAAPFDMSPEGQSVPGKIAPAPVQPQKVLPVPGQDGSTAPAPVTPQPPQAPAAGASAGLPASSASGQATGAPVLRYLVPVDKLVFSGEVAKRAWSVYLTGEQAASAAHLNLGYQNAIVVAPEMSRLRFMINGTALADLPIQSSNGVFETSLPVPAGLLRSGFNEITIEVSQRHRTDCGIDSTYELWTEIDQSRTFLSFTDPQAASLRRIDDIRAIGVDAGGRTSFRIVAPAADQRTTTASLIRLAEGLAILANMPNQSISISREAVADVKPGEMTVVVGTASELQDVLAVVPAGGAIAPLAMFTDDAKTGPSTLIITGPTWESLSVAIESIVVPTDRPVAITRTTLPTRTWRSPDTPLFTSTARLKFSELGEGTQQFSGKRFRTEFAVGIPSDFYADSYGQATILLDAAYSDEVQQGSHIDVYVNNNIAVTLPLTGEGGEILRHLPINVTLRHFRPGANVVAIEAVLLTRADSVCAPGASAEGIRFALFDTSEFVMPQFARIGRRPNLAAIAGTGFPYGRAEVPVPLVIDQTQSETLSAAATFMARMSAAAGRPIRVEPTVLGETVGNRDALFFGPASQLSPIVLSGLNISDAARTEWGSTVAGSGAATLDTNATFNEWRDRLAGKGWRGQINTLKEWLNRNFDISFDSIRLTPRADSLFLPSSDATLVIGQGSAPNDDGTWTLVTAPTAKDLDISMRTLTELANWDQLGGRITSLSETTGKIEQVPVNRFTFVQTQPGSFVNYRLILSNWLSANVLIYSALLAGACAFLGLVTAGLLQTLGRHR